MKMICISFEAFNILLLIKCRPLHLYVKDGLTGNVKPSCAGIALGMALGNSKKYLLFSFCKYRIEI